MKRKDQQAKRLIGRRLAQARAQKGWSLGELARRTEMDKALLSRYEDAEITPGGLNVRRLAICYGVSADWLLGLKS